MGSVHYLSPEQARGGYTDAKSDIYSLGIVMYEMVTGKLPFDGDNPVSVAIKQIQEKPVSPKEYNIALPLAVESIILKAMNKDQSKRYQTANDMLIDLEKAKISPNSELITDNEDDSGQTKKIPVVNIDEKAPSSSPSSSSTAKRPSAESKPDGGGMNKAEKKGGGMGGNNIGCFGSSAYYRYNFRYIPRHFQPLRKLNRGPGFNRQKLCRSKGIL
jgi:serine/threonine protein kinase